MDLQCDLYPKRRSEAVYKSLIIAEFPELLSQHLHQTLFTMESIYLRADVRDIVFGVFVFSERGK